MSYNYGTEKQKLFEEKNQKLFIGMRDHIQKLLKTAGAFRMNEAMILPDGVGAADSFCVPFPWLFSFSCLPVMYLRR